MSIRRLSVLVSFLVVAAGCGAEYRRASFSDAEHNPPASTWSSEAAGGGKTGPGVDGPGPGVDLPSAKKLADKDDVQRKIVYRADVDLVVEQFEPIPEQLEAQVKQHDGFIAGSTLQGAPGSPRTGRWTIRVPVARYAEFLAAVRQLGEVHRINTTSDDVTAEFYDVEARIRNKRQEEDRLLKLLAEATGKLPEILSVERELSRVRGEIEQLQGRVRVLRDLTDLTTVTVSVAEVKDYVPEQAASYRTRVRRVFENSISALVRTTQALSLAAVALAPWLALPLLVGLLIYFRRRIRRRKSRS